MAVGAPLVRLPALGGPAVGPCRVPGPDRLSADGPAPVTVAPSHERRGTAVQRRVLVAAVALAAVYGVVIWLQAGTKMPEWIPLMASWVVFAPLAVWVVRGGRRRPDGGRRTLLVLMNAAVIVQLPGLFAAPQMSTDAYRYVWDGRVQVAGVDPYRYVPLDDHLARLRDPVLFPGLTPADRTGVVSRGDSARRRPQAAGHGQPHRPDGAEPPARPDDLPTVGGGVVRRRVSTHAGGLGHVRRADVVPARRCRDHRPDRLVPAEVRA